MKLACSKRWIYFIQQFFLIRILLGRYDLSICKHWKNFAKYMTLKSCRGALRLLECSFYHSSEATCDRGTFFCIGHKYLTWIYSGHRQVQFSWSICQGACEGIYRCKLVPNSSIAIPTCAWTNILIEAVWSRQKRPNIATIPSKMEQFFVSGDSLSLSYDNWLKV